MTVPVMVRALTSDDADVRLLLEVRLVSVDLDGQWVERVVHALVVPAVTKWVRRHTLAGLQEALAPALHEPQACVREELAALGVDLLAVELVAAEHLLASPSGVTVDGPG